MIELTELHESHVNHFYQWIGDEEAIQYSLSIFQKLKSKEAIDKWYQQTLALPNTFQKGIYLKKEKKMIGYVGICNLSATNQSGEYFIFIGDKNYWNKGVGTKVTQEILAYGFNSLQLNRIMLTVSDLNYGGVKAYQKAGFTIEGKMREACYRNGKYHDKIIMSVLQSEYK